MKKFLMLTLILASFNLSAQDPIKREPNRKSIKTCLIFAGSSVAVGSVISVLKTYQKEPNYLDQASVKKYRQSQKDFTRISNMFFGAAGISLITICFNF